MGRRGPKPKPKELHQAEGTYRADRHDGPSFEAVPHCPAPPDWLCDGGKKQWQVTAPLLHTRKLLTEADLMAFTLLCQAWGEWKRATIELLESGLTFVTDNNNLIPHPCVGIANRAWTKVLQGAREFGLTPSSRTGLTLPDANSEADRDIAGVLGL